jgi:hypothetical protein
MDPITIMSAASTAFSLIQKGIQHGKDIEDMAGTLSKWAGAFSDISFMEKKAKDPPFYKAFSGSAEQEAIEIFAAKKKMEQQKKDLETLIGYTYGKTGLDEYLRTLREVRERRAKQQHRQQEIKEKVIEVLLAAFILSGGLLIVILFFWWFGKKQGKW